MSVPEDPNFALSIPEEKREELQALTLPVVKWLADNTHPHVKLIVDNTGYQLLEGLLGQHTMEFIKG